MKCPHSGKSAAGEALISPDLHSNRNQDAMPHWPWGNVGGEQEKRHHSSSPRVPTLLLHCSCTSIAWNPGPTVQQVAGEAVLEARQEEVKSTVTAECPALPLLRGQSASVQPCQFPRRGQRCRKWGRKAAGAYLSPFPRSFLKSPRDSRAGGCW